MDIPSLACVCLGHGLFVICGGPLFPFLRTPRYQPTDYGVLVLRMTINFTYARWCTADFPGLLARCCFTNFTRHHVCLARTFVHAYIYIVRFSQLHEHFAHICVWRWTLLTWCFCCII